MRYSKLIAATFVAGLMVSPLASAAHDAGAGAGKAKAQNMDRTMNGNSVSSSVLRHGWQNRIAVGGLLNVDGRWSNRDTIDPMLPGFKGGDEDDSDINVNNANLLFDARVNKFTRAHVGVAYVDDFRVRHEADDNTTAGDKGSAHSTSSLAVDEAYVTFNCFTNTPFFARFGKQYVPFGTYDDAYPLTYGLAQLLTQTRATAAEAGFALTNGAYAMVFGFNGPRSNTADSRRIRNWGGKAGYGGHVGRAKYDVNLSYLRDARDIDLLSDYTTLVSAGPAGNFRRTEAWAAHANTKIYGFDLNADYATFVDDINSSGAEGSKAWAYDLDATYGFRTLGRNSALGLTYSRSGDAGNIRILTGGGTHALPKRRLMAHYQYNIARNADVTVQYTHDEDYDTAEYAAATDNTTNVFSVRLGVKF